MVGPRVVLCESLGVLSFWGLLPSIFLRLSERSVKWLRKTWPAFWGQVFTSKRQHTMKWIYKKLTGGLFIQENVWGAFCGIACCEIHLWWGHTFLYLRLDVLPWMYPCIWYLRPCDYAQRYFKKFMENVCNEKTVHGFQFSCTKIDLSFPWIFFRFILKMGAGVIYLLVHSLNAVNSHSRTRLKPEFRIQSGSPPWISETKLLEPSPVAPRVHHS